MATLYDVPIHTIALPVQFMHHHDDACPASPFDDTTHDKFTGVANVENHFASATTTALAPVGMSVTGSGSPCGPVSYHGYWQLDDDSDVVPAIVAYIQAH